MIKIEHLTKNFGKLTAVNDLTLQIKENETLALLGLNGAGKSTTIKILCSLLTKTSGNIEINGLNIDKDSQKIKQIINVSPQETAIANNLTVSENLMFIANLYGLENIQKSVDEMLNKFNLNNKKNSKGKTLSGGQKRRLSIAMALITKPKILILDEPTLGLDIKARKELWNLITEYKNKTTIILTTHYLEEATNLSDRIAIMNCGKLVALGTEKEIIKSTKAKNFEDAFLMLAGGTDE